MKITINTDVLQKEHLSFGDFLVLLMGYHDLSYKEIQEKLIRDGIVQSNVFNKDAMVLSNNTKDLVTKILMESDNKILSCGLDFNTLAARLQEIYPSGNKPGTSYSWRDSNEIIAQKLRTLVAKYGFFFTEDEAIKATEEYVSSFENKEKMQLLKYFILKTDSHNDNINSMFMTIIENNR